MGTRSNDPSHRQGVELDNNDHFQGTPDD